MQLCVVMFECNVKLSLQVMSCLCNILDSVISHMGLHIGIVCILMIVHLAQIHSMV